MTWNVDAVREKFGEDTLRDICRDMNDLMCGRAGHGHHPNRIGVPDAIWRKLLTAGGYTEEGVEKAMRQEHLVQSDTCGPFNPLTILTMVNITENNGGPLSEEELDERSTSGEGFLAEVCRDWEQAALGAEEHGVRTVVLRIGIVLAREGGALPSMVRPFRFGLGGRLGSGQQWVPWIHVDDLVTLIRTAARDERYRGVFNAVAPETLITPLPAFVSEVRPPSYTPVTMRRHMETTLGNLDLGLGSWDAQRQRSLSATYQYD